MLTPRWVLMGRSMFEVNHVQYLEYRSTTIAGLGYFVVKSDQVSILLAPGVGYGRANRNCITRLRRISDSAGRVFTFLLATQTSVLLRSRLQSGQDRRHKILGVAGNAK